MERIQVNVFFIWFLAGICCVLGTAPLRLLGKASSPSLVQGILQIYYNGQWGTICSNSWYWAETNVACKQLGYDGAITYTHLGQGPDPIWLDSVNCHGGESSVDQCTHRGWGTHGCGHSQDVGIVCYTGPPVKVRLIGDVPNAGRVQLFYRGVWKNLCDSNWYSSQANVICRMAGYPDGYAVYFHHYKGSGDVWLSSSSCNGYEQFIESCTNLNWGKATCSNNSLAGVICKSGTPNVAFRLVSAQAPHAGRLEMRYYGSWKPVYFSSLFGYYHWKENSNVICRMMGYNQSIGVNELQESSESSIFRIYIDCSGLESTVEQCLLYHVSGRNSHYNSWIACKTDAGSRFTVRLMDGTSLNDGRVEIGYSGVWGTVSDMYSSWNLKAAYVVCHMLGYRNASWTGRARVLGKGFIMRIHKHCKGNETSLEYCEQYSYAWYLHHSNDVGLRCSGQEDPLTLEVRLESGDATPHSGRVGIRYGNSWSTLCYQGLDYHDVKVICRMLGYVDVDHVYAVMTPSSADGRVWLSGVECNGTEASILNCSRTGWWQTSCDHDAVVTCKTGTTAIDIRLENSSTPHSGRVGILYDSNWGTLCNKGLSTNDAKVICRMLGYDGVSHVFTIPGNGTIWLSDLECNGAEDSIVDCGHSGWWQTRNCSHDQDAAVTCKIADAPHFQIEAKDQITCCTVTLSLTKTTKSFDARLKSSYQFIVEKGREMPSPITSTNNVSIEICPAISKTVFSDAYIAAEVPTTPNNAKSFIIGDGLNYRGYHNVPLDPGCIYRVQVRVVTMAMNRKKVFGKSSFARFTTRPKIDPPEFEVTSSISINQTSAKITFIGKQQNLPRPNRWYQVVVERTYKDVFQSTKFAANHSYIAAEIPTTSSTFTIGDNAYYHGYKNPPLEPGCTYRVYLKVIIITLNEKRDISDATFVSFTTKFDGMHADTQERSKNSSNKEPLVTGLSVVMAITIVALIVYIVYNVVTKKRTKQRNGRTDNNRTTMEISDLASARAKRGESSDQQYQELNFPPQQNRTNVLRLPHNSQDIYQSLSPQTKSQNNNGYVEEQPSLAYHVANISRTAECSIV
ncbi:deleted in malignant brain tumors 1 protein isoform X2 [Exaiptasia diaphana]|uniref:SRCR domain-containing protein n=1 Tax=Exaiptasia diaphana TaxID=2652724 RepID=A0A913YV18_EXADI|nr:deleted in malignant brain tumors 1 protein isoform X2 [Exaiptasia diaphana]